LSGAQPVSATSIPMPSKLAENRGMIDIPCDTNRLSSLIGPIRRERD
jgi:hypothetical protein